MIRGKRDVQRGLVGISQASEIQLGLIDLGDDQPD